MNSSIYYKSLPLRVILFVSVNLSQFPIEMKLKNLCQRVFRILSNICDKAKIVNDFLKNKCLSYVYGPNTFTSIRNTLSVNHIKRSNTLNQLVGYCRCISVFYHFVGLAVKGLIPLNKYYHHSFNFWEPNTMYLMFNFKYNFLKWKWCTQLTVSF